MDLGKDLDLYVTPEIQDLQFEDHASVLEDVSILESAPILFNNHISTSNIKHIMLIDSNVDEKQLFYDSANTETFPIIYNCKKFEFSYS